MLLYGILASGQCQKLVRILLSDLNLYISDQLKMSLVALTEIKIKVLAFHWNLEGSHVHLKVPVLIQDVGAFVVNLFAGE